MPTRWCTCRSARCAFGTPSRRTCVSRAKPRRALRHSASQSVLHRCCSTQPQALPRDKLLEEVVELRVTKSVQDILHAEFKTLNAKIESSNTALTNNFRQAMKDREVRSPCCVGVYNTSVSQALRREASLSKSWLPLRALLASWRCSDLKSASTRRAHERSVENDRGGWDIGLG